MLKKCGHVERYLIYISSCSDVGDRIEEYVTESARDFSLQAMQTQIESTSLGE